MSGLRKIAIALTAVVVGIGGLELGAELGIPGVSGASGTG